MIRISSNKSIVFWLAFILTSIMLLSCSNKNERILIKDYFPIDKTGMYKFVGVFDDIQQKQSKEIIMEVERKGKEKVNGEEVYVQKSTYYDKSKNKISVAEAYFGYEDPGTILEFGRKNNENLDWHTVPNVYLKDMEIGRSYIGSDDRGQITIKGYTDLIINGKEYKNCLLVEKLFFDGKDMIRKEELYLYQDIGLVKYIEEASIDPYKLELSYVSE